MPRDISFAWTTPALLAGAKTVTRREWMDRYALGFHSQAEAIATDRQRRFKGKPIAIIRITQDLYQEWSNDAPPEDYAAEGFDFLTKIGAKVDGLSPGTLWRAWHMKAGQHQFYVVRFELVERLVPHPHYCARCLSAWEHVPKDCNEPPELEHVSQCSTLSEASPSR